MDENWIYISLTMAFVFTVSLVLFFGDLKSKRDNDLEMKKLELMVNAREATCSQD